MLKGHIAIARAVFPDGTSGAQLDSFARQSLWEAGLDFDHGTGHGVGSYLSVHEGPARISKLGAVALKRGMILSNEPGYYKTGAYGIRIENLVLVIAAPEVAGSEKPLNTFETLTLAPIDRRLVRARHAERRGDGVARLLSRARARNVVAAARCRDQRVAGGGNPPARAALKQPGDSLLNAPLGRKTEPDAGRTPLRLLALLIAMTGVELALAQHPGASDSKPGDQIRD